MAVKNTFKLNSKMKNGSHLIPNSIMEGNDVSDYKNARAKI